MAKLKYFQGVKGIILSGGPSTVTAKKFSKHPKIYLKKIPILGICYGLQLIAKLFGGEKIKPSKKREFRRELFVLRKNPHF